MDATKFDHQLGELAGSLGDTTRRGIYIAVRESSESVTVGQIAEMFEIHPNVARHHLDRLANDEYVTVTRQQAGDGTGPGAGRPAKRYTSSDKEIDLHYPARRPHLLTSMLLDVINDLAPDNAAELARKVGYRHGRRVAEEIGLPTEEGFEQSLRAVAKAMTGIGFEMEAEADRSRFVTNHCPFGETAINHPEVVCSLDQGLIAGLMASVDTTWEPVVFPHTTLSEPCVTEVAH